MNINKEKKKLKTTENRQGIHKTESQPTQNHEL